MFNDVELVTCVDVEKCPDVVSVMVLCAEQGVLRAFGRNLCESALVNLATTEGASQLGVGELPFQLDLQWTSWRY